MPYYEIVYDTVSVNPNSKQEKYNLKCKNLNSKKHQNQDKKESRDAPLLLYLIIIIT